ncbi:hypothetical protein ACQQ2N_09955 [Dokdonella sp. MW10]|uniref:hypothetical protein n=1 Tax=Dokdonella sp. MW10 TaxID=2992926 RepID=UPI003F7E5A50
MSKLLRVLEKVGLVETDDPPRPVSAPVAEPVTVAEPEPAPVAESEPVPEIVAPSGGIVEQRALEEIYAEQNVAAVPFSAEKLLRVLDGLAALDPAARKAAVLALDAADDTWAIEDVLLDAERKTRALDMAKRQLEAHARDQLQLAREAIQARDQRQQEAVARIRQQIGDLEALLEREVTRSTEEKSGLEAEARATKDACQRESARLDDERGRLARIAAIFGTGTGTTPASP